MYKKILTQLVSGWLWPLGVGFPYFWPENRILRDISALEPDSQIWNRISSLKNVEIIFSIKNLDSRHFQVSIYTVFDEESDFQVKNKEIRRPEGKI